MSAQPGFIVHGDGSTSAPPAHDSHEHLPRQQIDSVILGQCPDTQQWYLQVGDEVVHLSLREMRDAESVLFSRRVRQPYEP